ncbi:MAG: lysophospholipid acyltransferase family protein [Deltaproteobacteria bacterium]|jgi:lysophospholipid acyltransferase (LPLAT)-like uncharacterized protein|nr:lysophospholipid acyltransferase family protein [Deltaproteobacteria bacterium]
MKPWKFLLIYVLSWLFRIFGTIILSTCHVRVFGREIEKKYFEDNPGKSLLYASWHRGVIYSVFFYRNARFVGMASTSDDGEIAAQGARRFGWKIVRGSSTRRGSQALREMISMTQKGYRAGLVVDAPRGPAHLSKPGVIVLAKMSGIPLLTGIWSADRYWRVNSWDRTIIPKPFARIVGLYSESLIKVPPDASREECEQYRQQLDNTLNKLMYQTDHFFTTPGITDPRQIKVPDPVPRPF